MTASNDHMTGEDVLRVLHSRACPEKDDVTSKLEEHLRHCQRCAAVVGEYQRFMSRLYEHSDPRQTQGKCPDPALWGELAAGLLSQQDATDHLRHAASCSACTEELLYALDALSSNSGPPDALEQNLKTADAGWAKEFAAGIAARPDSPRPDSIRQAKPQVVSIARSPRRLTMPAWAYAGIAALVTLGIGLGLYSWLRGRSSETLIREAYAQQRTVEMRIPGAAYGPVRVQRAGARSEISSPRALLEAEVEIKRGLEKRPDDVDLLRQKAEADLLNWNYQPALDTLNRAARLRPGSFDVLVDTATAYFERGEATANPADYEAGLQSLGDAIRLKPDDAAALFNRAILCERLYFYGRAVADWEQFLKIETDPGWRNEAEQRLNDLRERLRQHGSIQVPDQLTPADFKNQVESLDLPDPEEYAEAAKRRFLPEVSAGDASEESYKAVSALANNLRTQHSDAFLTDLLSSSHEPRFNDAVRLLGQGSSSNRIGRYEQAYASGRQSASLFRGMNNVAGELAAEFEQLYSLQFEAKAKPCAVAAARAVTAAQAKGYAILVVQLLLEQGICSNMSGDLRSARRLFQESLAVAKSHGYMSFYLRGLTMLADLDDQEGDEAGAWSAIQQGLGLYWQRPLPPLRAYSLYVVLDFLAERLGHDHVQFAAAYEAVNFGFRNPDRNVEAAERVRLANAALRTGELQLAKTEFNQASEIFVAATPPGTANWRELEARVGLARVQMLQGEKLAEAADALLALLPHVRRLSNRYVEFQYYEILAELKWRLHDDESAKQFLDAAISITETGLRSLVAWKERSAWMEQHRQAYMLMTQLLLRSGQQQPALALWEHFRSADTAPISGPSPLTSLDSNAPRFRTVANQAAPQVVILTYALGQQRLAIWVRSERETHAVFVQEPFGLRSTADNFIAECSRPDSDLAGLQADARLLYGWLIEPVSSWLPASGRLIVEPDGILGALPFEALLGPGSKYLGERYAITVTASVRARFPAPDRELLPSTVRALIVAAPASRDALAEPPPGALTEAFRIAQRFHNPVLLAGRDATILPVEQALGSSNVFHFAGHGALGRNGAGMIMADGTLGIDATAIFRPNHLEHLKLAVLSACDTARPGELTGDDGLVSEFLEAGAGNVVASRWSVDSLATVDFMDLFYGSILSGDGVAESLQFAGQTLRTKPGRSHPYYWAGFAAFGRS